MGLKRRDILLMVGMLVTGTINTLVKSIQLRCIAPGLPDSTHNNTVEPHKFSKPWFQTLLMFIGEAMCLFAILVMAIYKKIQTKRYQRLYPEEIETVDATNTAKHKWWEYFLFVLPTSCDLLGTSLAGIGLLFISASIWQMMRGCLIIFTGILSMIFLKRKMYCYNWTGMCFTVLGLALVGVASVFTKGGTSHQDAGSAILGISLVMAGCMCSAVQMIVEEKLLKSRNFHSLQVVGFEGTFGTLLMAFVALPIMQQVHGADIGGVYENTLDTLAMMANSTPLLLTSFFYMVSIAFFNYFGLSVVKSLTSVHRTLIDALRTLMVWIVDLIIYYLIDNAYGEEFNKEFGILQIDGFACLIIGTAIYNRVMSLDFLPCCHIPVEPTIPVVASEPVTDDNFVSSQEVMRSLAAENGIYHQPVHVGVMNDHEEDVYINNGYEAHLPRDVEVPSSTTGRPGEVFIVPSPK